jgi:hypothetical protein
MHRFYPLLRVFGALLIGFSICLAVPMAVSWYVDDGAHSAFDEPSRRPWSAVWPCSSACTANDAK